MDIDCIFSYEYLLNHNWDIYLYMLKLKHEVRTLNSYSQYRDLMRLNRSDNFEALSVLLDEFQQDKIQKQMS